MLAGRSSDGYADAVATRKLQYEGREVIGEDISFRITGDGAVTLELEDGAVLRLRHIVVNVIRTNEKDGGGERLYLVQSATQVISVKPAKEDEA